MTFAVLKSLVETIDDCSNGYAAFGMRLRIEKYLGVAHILFVRLFQISPREIVKIPVLEQDSGPLIVNIEKRL